MAQDYAKHVPYHKGRWKRNRLWKTLGLSLGLLVLGLGLLLFRSPVTHHRTQQTKSKLQQEAVDTLLSKPPEPRFDFYNILPQKSLSSSSSPSLDNLASANTEQASISMADDVTSVPSSSRLQKPLAGFVEITPERLAMAEAKKQLEEEMSRFNKDTYILMLGNFQQATQAEQYQAQALLKGFPVQNKVYSANGRVIYQLFMGPYLGLVLASQQQQRLHAAGIKPVLIKSRS